MALLMLVAGFILGFIAGEHLADRDFSWAIFYGLCAMGCFGCFIHSANGKSPTGEHVPEERQQQKKG
jgi:hypothetical protein